jgi:hypothetical protein
MLIDFELTPIEQVVPWGVTGNLSLHWFGLTDGQYWINVGEDRLFEYSDPARHNDGKRYCDYQVARLFEDVMEMLPTILDPVPKDIRRYVSGHSGREWMKSYEYWAEQNLGADAGSEIWDIHDRAILLLSGRHLSTMHLSPSTSILMWSDDDNVHIEWDNSDKYIDGVLAWSATVGSFHLTREQFVIEVNAFQTKLFAEMHSRIEQVAAGGLRPDIQIDLPGLIAENERRQIEFAKVLGKNAGTSWDEIRSAVFEISSYAASNT